MIFPSRDLIRVIGNVCFLNGPISGYRACSRRGQGQPRSMRTTLTRRWMQARTKVRGKRYRLRWDVTSKWKVRRENRAMKEEDETRARHSEHKARRDDGNVLPGRVEQRRTTRLAEGRQNERYRVGSIELVVRLCCAHINTS